MYTMDWLVDRVREHIDPARQIGEVFVAEIGDGAIVGHTIVRVERDEDGAEFGLFSTFYVMPEFRSAGIGSALIEQGELWMRQHGLRRASTYTAETNETLHRLMGRHGYAIVLKKESMVVLSKPLDSCEAE